MGIGPFFAYRAEIAAYRADTYYKFVRGENPSGGID